MMGSTIKITVFVAVYIILMRVDFSSSAALPDTDSENGSFLLKFTERFGVTEVNRQEINCNTMKDGEHCPYSSSYDENVATNFASQPLRNRSSSPWFVHYTSDESRTPQIIPMACCACIYCVKRDSNGNAFKEKTMYSYPVNIMIDVKYKQTGRLPVTRSVEIPVGCTCSESKYRMR